MDSRLSKNKRNKRKISKRCLKEYKRGNYVPSHTPEEYARNVYRIQYQTKSYYTKATTNCFGLPGSGSPPKS